MRSHRVLASTLLLAAALTLTACDDGGTGTGAGPTSPGGPTNPGAQSSPGSPTLDLVGRTYVGDQVAVGGEPDPLVKNTTIRLTFSDGSIGASAGCNQMGGNATWDDGVLHAKTLFSTEMGCAQPLMKQDKWLADFLSSEPTLQQSGGTLTLSADDTVVALADEQVVVPDVTLTGTTWQLDTVINGDVASSVPAGVRSTLYFDVMGRVTVRPGCNSGSSEYTATDDTITFKPIALTMMACPGAKMEIENSVIGVLDGAVAYSIDGTTLTLTPPKAGPDGTTALIYRARSGEAR